MINNLFRFFLNLVLAVSLFNPGRLLAADINLEDLALPSEVEELGKTSGSVYYSSTNKNKPLMPVHIWGEVNRSGLHYIPVDTKLIKGLSFAGGSSGKADLENVTVTRLIDGNTTKHKFDLSDGGNAEAYTYVLQPGDTIFVKDDKFYENRAYYTSLVGVAVAILSSIILYRRIEDRN